MKFTSWDSIELKAAKTPKILQNPIKYRDFQRMLQTPRNCMLEMVNFFKKMYDVGGTF